MGASGEALRLMKTLIVGDAFDLPNTTGATARAHAYAGDLIANALETTEVRSLCSC